MDVAEQIRKPAPASRFLGRGTRSGKSLHSTLASLRQFQLSRALGIAAGVATHVLFVYTVWHLFWFLKSGRPATEPTSLWRAAGLALMFAVPHSLLLWPPIRSRLGRMIPAAFYGLFYCAATCVSLLLVFLYWKGSTPVLWELTGPAAVAMHIGFAASWISLFYSLHLTGLGYQTGLTPWLHWVRRIPQPKRGFSPRGAYRWLRHPVYLSFLGLVWFTPTMSADHAVLTGLWTGYLLVGSYLKDERLAFYLRDSYRRYQEQVPGYPGMPWGPLARRRPAVDARSVASHVPASASPTHVPGQRAA